MYTNVRNSAQAYANIGLETGILGASPQRLVVLLYEGAELAVRMAIRHIHERDLVKKTAAINKASNIIQDGLRASLDAERGGEIALQLDALYDYMLKRIMQAHLKNETAPLEEVLALLQELHEAWTQIGAQGAAPARSLAHPIAA